MATTAQARNPPEIRRNLATREWVIYAPSRGRRPSDFRRSRPGSAELPEHDERCPFCPGNEARLPPVLLELPGPDASGWQTRVVPNKFPALCPELGTARARRGIYVAMPGSGRHEVVIESPTHSRQLAAMTPAEVEAVIETYHRRYSDLMALHGSMMAILFRNHGEGAGTSLVHPHSQVIVTDLVPARVRGREQAAQDHFDEWGRCVFCEILASEDRERVRVVAENASFLAWVPFAAEVPFETWIMPRRHEADFGAVTDGEKTDLAAVLRQVLTSLCDGLGDPDYNYVVNTAARYRADEPQLHWYMQIRPRLTTPAGFELGSGISINPSVPEADAAFLRDALPKAGPAHRVLVVEDDPVVREVVGHGLAQYGYGVRVVQDGPAAIAAAREKALDAVVLDLRLPGMAGRDVLRTLKTLQPSLPVFVFSARGDFPDTVASLPEADGCFAKSADLTPLLGALGRALRRRRNDP